ncbi:hypothetical protein MMG00_12810 [Ignatzschineria rhizosphaerae]|uniref:Uncharacterized protein n=1 Tax=Ignatzschineria rhizosphaerae TaxID=2923279 RepID=A0ABY3X3M8_9GAMM|nr:hypothetical protein [Ignatzschineria rhizosphaerae]UNM96062.1 hypothetical protein MMG00_12810 [Ignatzschineria rhizosphaerae]
MTYFQIVILAPFCLLLLIALSLFLYEICGLKKLFKWWLGLDFDTKIIGTAPCILLIILVLIFLVSDTTEGYKSIVSMMLQVSGVSLGLVAATIAFRNYLRKSGDKISYIPIKMNTNEGYSFLLHNQKDKQAFVFAIDAVLAKNKKRIRLVDYSKPPMELITISPFGSQQIDLPKADKYGDSDLLSFDIEEVSHLICITTNGEMKVEEQIFKSLSDKYIEQENIIRSNYIINKPLEYDFEVSPKARYWVFFDYSYSTSYSGISSSRAILTAYIENGQFLVCECMDNKINDKRYYSYILEKAHKKTVDESNYCSYGDKKASEGTYLVNGLLEQELHIDYILKPAIKIISINKISYSNIPML